MRLESWLAVPLTRRNGRTILAWIAGTVCTVVLTGDAADSPAVMRQVALALAVLYGAQHYLTLVGLDTMVRRGLPHASEAAAAYRDPRALSNLDVAMAWLGFHVAVPWLHRWAGA